MHVGSKAPSLPTQFFFFTMKMSIVCLLRHHFGDVDTVAHELLRRTSLHLQCSLHLLQNTHSFTQRRSVNFLNALVSAFPSDKKIIIYALFFVRVEPIPLWKSLNNRIGISLDLEKESCENLINNIVLNRHWLKVPLKTAQTMITLLKMSWQ